MAAHPAVLLILCQQSARRPATGPLFNRHTHQIRPPYWDSSPPPRTVRVPSNSCPPSIGLRKSTLRHPEPLGDAPMRFAVGTAGHGVRDDASAQINRTPETLAPAPLSLLGKLFGEVLALLDDPLVVRLRSIAGQSLQIKTGYGEEIQPLFAPSTLRARWNPVEVASQGRPGGRAFERRAMVRLGTRRTIRDGKTRCACQNKARVGIQSNQTRDLDSKRHETHPRAISLWEAFGPFSLTC